MQMSLNKHAQADKSELSHLHANWINVNENKQLDDDLLLPWFMWQIEWRWCQARQLSELFIAAFYGTEIFTGSNGNVVWSISYWSKTLDGWLYTCRGYVLRLTTNCQLLLSAYPMNFMGPCLYTKPSINGVKTVGSKIWPICISGISAFTENYRKSTDRNPMQFFNIHVLNQRVLIIFLTVSPK